MAERIKLVQGDSLPYVTLTLTDSATGSAINLSAGTTSVRVFFRAVGSTTVLATILCTKLNGGADGIIRFNFTGGVLNVDPGPYEGEVEINFDGATQTLYDLLKFTVRQQVSSFA